LIANETEVLRTSPNTSLGQDDKIIYSKVKSYFGRLLRTLHFWENEEISKVLYFFLFGEMKLVETVFLSIRFKFKQISYSVKEIAFFVVDWGL